MAPVRPNYVRTTVNQRKLARYEEIASDLRSLIAAAAPGDRLPSDAELCEKYGVSRMTARQAVQAVAADGLVDRRRGAGTFVRPQSVLRELGSPLSFTESMRRRGMTASSRILKWAEIQPSDQERSALGLRSGEPARVLERLRLADDLPMAIERAVMPASLAASLEGDLEQGSLHAAFEQVGRIPTEAFAEVSARHPTKRQRQLLELPASGILLCELRTISDQEGLPLERTETFYASSRYTFRAVLVRNDGRRT
ncbi:MAG: GntR family transcriptional regulator [Actinomycetota bacterium]|nr:GntR family transcriptional regulator [Actinomycetota bacterium]